VALGALDARTAGQVTALLARVSAMLLRLAVRVASDSR
jgi:hypothetical protein